MMRGYISTCVIPFLKLFFAEASLPNSYQGEVFLFPAKGCAGGGV